MVGWLVVVVPQALSAKCHELRALNLRRVFQIGAQALKCIAEGCPLLQELNLQYCAKVGGGAARDVTLCRSVWCRVRDVIVSWVLN